MTPTGRTYLVWNNHAKVVLACLHLEVMFTFIFLGPHLAASGSFAITGCTNIVVVLHYMMALFNYLLNTVFFEFFACRCLLMHAVILMLAVACCCSVMSQSQIELFQ